MNKAQYLFMFSMLLPLTVVIIYSDVKYRRIPNNVVLLALFGGLGSHVIWNGWRGLAMGVAGCVVAFGLMLMLHLFGALGAGDVKLFGAIGGIIGLSFVFKTFLIVLMLGGVLAFISMIYTGTVQITLQRVFLLFAGLLPGWKMPRYEVTPDRHTIPYGVAIMLGTLTSLGILSH